MGDRTYAELTIHKFHYQQNKKELEATGYHDEVRDDNDETVTFVCYEANYGHMEGLESECQERNIEYNLRWENCGDYNAGEEFFRIVDGEHKVHSIYDTQEETLTALKKVAEIVVKDGATLDEVAKHLTDKIKELEPFEVKPLRGPNSIDFIRNA